MKLAKLTLPVVLVLVELVALYACQQSAEIAISVEAPKNQTVSFDREDGEAVSCDSSLIVSVNSGFDAYSWCLDGEALLGQNTRTISVDCSSLFLGTHSLAVLVENQGVIFSDSLRFRVEN
jgi:hypothetical protein